MRGARLHGLHATLAGADRVVDYVYPGSIDVLRSDGGRQLGRETQNVPLGHYPAEPELTAELALDPARWTWRPSTTPRARIWARHVFAADAAFRIQSYEFEGEVVLVWHGLPVREAETTLLAAGFRASLATWRAPATPDTREIVGAVARMNVADRRAHTMGASPIPIPATDDAQDRAQHAWMRWHALFGDTLAVGRRTYEILGRPGLQGERLTIELRHGASPLKVHFDVGQHPLVHRVHFDVDGAVLEMGGLAWADLPHAVAQLDSFILEGAARNRPAKIESVTSESRAAVGRKERPGSLQEEVGAALRALKLPPDKYAHYRRQAEKAIALGKSYLPVVRRAQRKAEQLRVARPDARTSVANSASTEAPWADRVVDAFNAEPGPRLAVARKRGAVTVFVVRPEGGTEAQALASIDVLHDEIEDVRWLDDGVAASAQEAVEERLERALDAARNDGPASTRSPLEGLVELMQRRGRELGVDLEQAARSGRTDEYARIATILRDLSDRTGTTAKDLSDWLIGRGLHKAGDMVEEYSRDEGPVEEFVGWLWDELMDAIGLGEIVRKADGLYAPSEALFDRGQDGTAVLLVREPVGRGRSLLRRVAVVVRDCENDDEDAVCGIRVEDPGERIQGGEEVWLRFESEGSGFYRELIERVHDFEETVRRAPRTLQDVRMLLYWTAVMIEAPRCQGELKRAVLVALEEAKHYYDLAARRLAAGRDSDAVARMHEALRRISAAAAELAQNCGEGQGVLVLPTLPTRPEDEALFGEPRRGRANDRRSDATPSATASSRARPAQARLTTVAIAASESAARGSGLLPVPAAIPAGVQRLSSTRDILACVGRLLWIESGGSMAGKTAMTNERLALVVQRATGSPEFPTLVNLNLPRIAERFPEGAMIGLIELDPVTVSLIGELTHVDQFLLESAFHGAVRDAYLSVVPRGVRPTHRIGPGKGAWEGTASDAVGLSGNPTCTKCPFVLGANLDCDVCRRWILSLKRQGEPWTVEHLQEAIYRSCASTLVPGAALGALAATTAQPLTPEFFREFAEGFARRLPEGLDRFEMDRCRSIVEYQLVQPDFPLPVEAGPKDASHGGPAVEVDRRAGHRTRMFTREERT